jgi:hypothetical protein
MPLASGDDNITLQMIKLCFPLISNHILHIINCCIEQSYFPAKWKTALVTPLPKTSTTTSLNDLRPISLLPTLSKILEKIVYQQMIAYVDSCNILPVSQSGFRKAHSTTSALLNITDNILRGYDQNLLTILVSLDYSKAFDTIDHDLMCAKLHYYGFSISSIDFFKSYLYNRYQKVTIKSLCSDSALVASGVPQGSILGPLLFLIYISDLEQVIRHCNIQCYADDTQLLYSFDPNNYKDAVRTINDDLQRIFTFSSEHNLVLNPNKSVCMLFGPKKKSISIRNQLSIKINGNNLNFSNKCKILGVFIDDKLSFAEHVSSLLQKSYIRLNFKLKKQLCESLVLSIFSYGNIIYYPFLTQIQKRRIQMIQHMCCRFISNLRKFDHISISLSKLNWLSFENKFKYLFLVFIYKLIKTSSPDYLIKKLVFRNTIHCANLRNVDNLTIPVHKTSQFKKSFSYNSAILFNTFYINKSSLNGFQQYARSALLRS